MQNVYRLDAVRSRATRFEAAVSRGLSPFVGRERELEVLERVHYEARSRLCVVDLAAEPGMGKSRLLHEFRRRLDRTLVLSGSCSQDSQRTAFLPFIEVVRGLFRVSIGEPETEIKQKLEMGLTALGLHSARNVGLLLHLLGLKVPDGALTGLDGVLIGLRTRELLQQLLEARSGLSPVVMTMEDLHWIDSASEEVLGHIVDSAAKLRLLILTTRRPEYQPTWLDLNVVTKLQLEPLPMGDIRRLVQARLGVDAVPEAFARQVIERAEGNPLFAEEIVSYLTERGIIHTTVDFDASAVAAALPASVQSLLTARIDRLAPKDRALLQAASVIGRRFDPQLLSIAVNETDVDARIAAMQPLDLVHLEHASGDYTFKHALVRDALYQSLLSDVRTALHAKIAAEIERRSGNRLAEVAEMLAHHYSHAGHVGKAFAFLSMAGSKSLGVYSIDEATTHFSGALDLLDKNPDCASDDQIADFLLAYTRLLSMSCKLRLAVEVTQRYFTRIDHLGVDPKAVLIRCQYVWALLWNARYQEAAAMQRDVSLMANRLGDSTSKAYSLAGEIHVSTMVAPMPMDRFEEVKGEAIKATADTADAYIQNWTRFVIGWDEIHRGRMIEARDAAHELMRVGRLISDPRSTGLGLALLAWIALVADSYAEALEYSEQSLAVAVTSFDRSCALSGKGNALVMLRRTDEGLQLLEAANQRSLADGDLYTLVGNEGAIGVCKVLQGHIRHGIRLLEEAISRREKEGYRTAADWYRLFLSEVYLQIIAGNEKLSPVTLLRNLPTLVKIMFTASSRVRTLMTALKDNPHFNPEGHHAGRIEMILGMLYKAKNKRAAALQHLTEARRILSKFGDTPILSRVDAGLVELGA
nr:AAA family ATPase [Bradyrhizobium sp. 157]